MKSLPYAPLAAAGAAAPMSFSPYGLQFLSVPPVMQRQKPSRSPFAMRLKPRAD